MIKNKRVLVLNIDYRPIGVISWKRAIVLNFINIEDSKKGLKAIEYYTNDNIKTQYINYPVPAVVISPIFIKQRKQTVPFSRKNLFIRDKFTCQYCGKPIDDITMLEYDHVISRAEWKKKQYKGTPTSFTNVVAACRPCNRKKADRSLKNTDMKLLREPKNPNISNFILGINPYDKNIPDIWLKYLPPLYIELYERFHKINKKSINGVQ